MQSNKIKFAITCLTHQPLNGGTKYQVYLFKELVKLGHECHFFLEDARRPNWANTDGIYYHNIKELENHKGDFLISNWYRTANQLNNPINKNNWKQRILIIHDTPTANNQENCLFGDFKIMGVSGMVLGIATGIHNVENRVYPLFVNSGSNGEIFNDSNKNIDNNKIICGVVGLDGLHRGKGEQFRGSECAVEIIQNLQKTNDKIELVCFCGNSEEEMANNYKKIHFLFELPLLAGCPTCVIESMACGTPCITTYHGTTHIVFNNINGIILPKLNIKYCTDYLSENLTIENYEYFKSNIDKKELTWENTVNNFLTNLRY